MGTFIISGAAVRKAGDNVDVSQPEAFWIESISGAEATIMSAARNSFSSFSVGDAKDHLLTDVASRLVAIDAWNSRPTGSDGTTDRIEFEDRINILRDGALRGLSLIRDKKRVDFINGS